MLTDNKYLTEWMGLLTFIKYSPLLLTNYFIYLMASWWNFVLFSLLHSHYRKSCVQLDDAKLKTLNYEILNSNATSSAEVHRNVGYLFAIQHGARRMSQVLFHANYFVVYSTLPALSFKIFLMHILIPTHPLKLMLKRSNGRFLANFKIWR